MDGEFVIVVALLVLLGALVVFVVNPLYEQNRQMTNRLDELERDINNVDLKIITVKNHTNNLVNDLNAMNLKIITIKNNTNTLLDKVNILLARP